MPARDPYEVLGVRKDATQDEIKSAFRKLARQYHPDVNPGDDTAEAKFKEIGEAYGIVGDPEKRARFDQFGVTDDQAGGAWSGGGYQDVGFGDLFEAFFGGMGASAGRRGGVRDGDDIRADAHVTLQDVLHGAEIDVRYRRSAQCDLCKGAGTADGGPPKTCPDCGGRGAVTAVRQTILGSIRTQTPCAKCRGEGMLIENPCSSCKGEGVLPKTEDLIVTVPAGIDSGQTLRVGNRGSDGVRGGTTGDLYVVVHVKEDARFERRGRDLATEVELTIAQATLGDMVEIEGLDGTLEVSIDHGTQPGDVMRIKGEGLPRIGTTNRGDLFVYAKVVVPKKVSEAEANLLKEFAELRGESVPKPADKAGFLEGLFRKKK